MGRARGGDAAGRGSGLGEFEEEDEEEEEAREERCGGDGGGMRRRSREEGRVRFEVPFFSEFDCKFTARGK